MGEKIMYKTEKIMYLVNGDMDGVHYVNVMTAAGIFHLMDMADCYPFPFEIDVWRINGLGEAPSECSFLRKGFDRSDPQKMMIVGGGWYEIGYGTEH